MTQPLELPRREQDLYDLLAGKGDVPIPVLYAGMGGPDGADQLRQQQWLGAYVTKLNRRVKNLKMRVRPGEARGTYALVIV